MGEPLIYGIVVFLALIVSTSIAWRIASVQSTKSMTAKLDEAKKQASIAENESFKMQGTIEELRKQITKSEENYGILRLKMEAELESKVKAEAQHSEIVLRLEEEKKRLSESLRHQKVHASVESQLKGKKGIPII